MLSSALRRSALTDCEDFSRSVTAKSLEFIVSDFYSRAVATTEVILIYNFAKFQNISLRAETPCSIRFSNQSKCEHIEVPTTQKYSDRA